MSKNLGGCSTYTTASILIRNGIYDVMGAKIKKSTKPFEQGCITFHVKGFTFYSMLHRGMPDLVEFQQTIDKIIKLDEYGIYSESLGDDRKSRRVGIAVDNKVNSRRYERFPELENKVVPIASFWDFFKY